MAHHGKILDEFTNLPVSRQRKLQLRALKAGLCSGCFKQPVFRAERCKSCYGKLLKRNARYRLQNRRKYRLWLKRWRAANPNYAREYYRKQKAAAQK
jgi:hypothetical protein